MYNVHPYFSVKNLGKKVCIIHSKIQYLSVFKMRKSNIKMPADLASDTLMRCLLVVLSRIRGREKSVGVSSNRPLISFMGLYPHDLIPTQRPYFLIPSHWGLGF